MAEGDLADRVAEYLNREGWEKEVLFEDILEEYPHTVLQDGRVELNDPDGIKGVIIQAPEDPLLDDVKEYLQEGSASGKLRKLGDMLSQLRARVYSRRWMEVRGA